MSRAKEFCEWRNEAADNLVELAIKLSIVANQMAEIATAGNHEAFSQAKSEMERLRDESENIRSQLAHHRLKHGC